MIAIQNVYYMLSYAFQVLNEQGYKNIAAEKFENTAELCAAILSRGIAVQIKRGLGREYIPITESRAVLRGKLEIVDSIRYRTILKRQMVCTYDDFSVNTYKNQIIKSTILLLLKADITKNRKKELRKRLVYFKDIEEIDLHQIRWNIQYDRNNQTYRMYSGTLVKTKIDKFLNVSGSRHCSIKQQCREVALCWRDVPDG